MAYFMMELDNTLQNDLGNGDMVGGRNANFENPSNETRETRNQNSNFDVTFFCQNVRGLNQEEKRKSIFNYAKSKAGIVFLQETHSVQLLEQSWEQEWGGKIIFSHGTSASRGCMIMISSTLEHNIVDSIRDENGRFF